MHLVVHEQGLREEVGCATQVSTARLPLSGQRREPPQARSRALKKGLLAWGHLSRALATRTVLCQKELHQDEGGFGAGTVAGAGEFPHRSFRDLQDTPRVEPTDELNGRSGPAPDLPLQEMTRQARALHLRPDLIRHPARSTHLEGSVMVPGSCQA